ncbi:MAG TPA: HD domain-containing phosphohydrolase [Candidatus Dormibacteraeota bacterium]|jgi:response regulator RpfG family c-di-GMP phosphodiesterase|nr:HD domain-containing phosphohydrolase [Candidatus Dormibacteraeota bacterium]
MMSTVTRAAEKDTATTKIVIVEDDPASADVLKRRLEANGMFVAHGPTGEEGLRLVRELLPDLVLLDVMLPDTSGYEVCLKIKSDMLTSRIPVIFLSARGDVFDKVRGLSSGAVDYLTKPFHPAELLARVDAVLRHVEPDAPRLPAPAEFGAARRPVALVLVADDQRRGRLEAKLRDHFELAAANTSQDVDLVVVEDGRQTPNVGEATVLHLSGNDDVARIDAELVRIADLAARQRTLRGDLKAATDALVTLAKALEQHDRSSPPHGEQTAERAVALARALHLDEDAQSRIRLGAQLRDIGYAKLPPELVAHRGQLSSEEREVIERHPLLGEELLRGFTPLAHVLPIVRMHHEHLDGSGYPTRVRGEEIPLEVRIVTVADRYEALLVDRPDRAAVRAEEAVHMLQEEVVRGRLDAAVVAALATMVREESKP